MSERRQALEAAFTALLRAGGREAEGDFADTPKRAAALWDERLLAGEGAPLDAALGEAILDEARTQPVSMLDMGVHLVCPHHLTISFGKAHVAYQPAGRIVGFGGLARLVERATARLVLQEEATDDIAATLERVLAPRAVLAIVEATHPCHNVPHPRSQDARALTSARRGDPEAIAELERLLAART
jgi:GTP cyclohydrolase I